MTDPIRAALERLIARLDETTDPNGPVPAWSDSFYAARAALSADGPAVPEGREPAAVVGEPSDGEVAELVAKLRRLAPQNPLGTADPTLTRAADLLAQRLPTLVPVSERLPGPEDCDAKHYCWRWNTIGGLWARQPLARKWYEFETHWLPAHALPLPAGEVQP